MLRSLDYAAAAALSRDEWLQRWAALWLEKMTETLASEYFIAMQSAATIPTAESDRVTLLRAYLLDRALREVGHEVTRMTQNVGIALAAAVRLLHQPPA